MKKELGYCDVQCMSIKDAKDRLKYTCSVIDRCSVLLVYATKRPYYVGMRKDIEEAKNLLIKYPFYVSDPDITLGSGIDLVECIMSWFSYEKDLLEMKLTDEI